MSDRNRRRLTAVVTVVLTAVIAGALHPPDALQAGTTTVTTPMRVFAGLAAAAIAAIGVLPALLGRSIAHRPVWIGAAVVSLTLGIGGYVGGGALQRACTARYDGRAVMVGTTLNEVGASYAAANPELSAEELLFDAAGAPERVWTRASIDRCRTSVGATYFLWVPCLAFCLFACGHALPSGLQPVAIARPGAVTTPESSALPALPVLYDVFISYRHGGHDAEFAHELLSVLERRGYHVAIDERDFPANASFLQEMERCIRQSRFTVAVLSTRYLGSGHCEEEAIVCKVLDMGDRQRRLIPVVIEPVALPAWLFGIVGIDCTRPNPLVDPLDKLQSTLGPPLSRGAVRA